MKLSICMMVKDEEKNLKRCLDNLKPIVESQLAELIIVDTGSTDNTVSIARKYTSNVYFQKWNKNFSEMRNISISYAKGEWILIIDADERLDDFEKLIQLMNSRELDKFNTIILQVKNLVNLSDENRYDLITSPRIFRNDGMFRYEGAVHNQPIFKGPNLCVDISLTHFGYISTDKELMERKYKRTTELLKLELQKNPKDLYYIYQLGTSYDMHGDIKEALEEFRKAYGILKLKKSEDKKMYSYIYGSYARIAYLNKEYKESIKIAKEGLTLKKDYIDLYYLIGLLEKVFGNKEDSFNYFNKYIELVEKYNELEISKDLSIIMYNVDENSKSNAYFQIVQLYIDKEKYKEAYYIYKNIINVSEKIYAGLNILIVLEKYSELKEVYDSITSIKDRNIFLNTLEEKIKKLEVSHKIRLYNEFSLKDDLYGQFNKLRLSNNIDEKIRLTKLLINEIDFNKEPLFYSEIFENIKEDIKLIIDAFNGIELWNLNGIIKFLVEEKGFKEIFESYISGNNINITNLKELKIYILIATILMAIYIKNNNEISDKYLDIFKLYIKAGVNFISQLYQVNHVEMIYKSVNNEEDRFFMVMYMIDNYLKNDDKKSAIKYMIEAVNLNKALSKYIDIYKDEIFNLKATNLLKEEKEQFENFKLKVKENINSLISEGNLNEAKKLIVEYEEIVKQDIEIYSMRAVICILENKLEDAEFILKSGLEIDDKNFDLIYNLAYLHEQTGKFSEAREYYIKAKNYCNDYNVKKEIESLIDNIREKCPNLIIKPKEKIAFFVKQGMDSFLGDIIEGLTKEYEIKKIIVTEYKQIDEGMEWADICWFEWCDELIIYGSNLPLAREKKIICRIHGYEVYTDLIKKPKWKNVDELIIVAPHIKRLFEENTKDIDKGNLNIKLVFCGVNVEAYPLNIKAKGFNIGYLGYINYKKNIPLTLDIFKKLHDKDSRYRLYLAGQFQDDRTLSYLKYFINEHKLNGTIQFDGWKNYNEKVEWFKKIDYIVISSIDEGLCYAAAESMCSGIKPILHNCEGIKDHYDKKYIFSTIDEAIRMITSDEYISKEYRKFIEDNYSLDKEIGSVLKIVDPLREKQARY